MATLHQSEESKARGRAVRKAISGSEGSRSTGNAAGLDMVPGLEDFVIGFNFGEIWSRDKIDLKTRCMIVLGMLTAMGRTPQVTAYTRYALHLGITPEEISEVFSAGHPLRRTARRVQRHAGGQRRLRRARHQR